LIQQFEVERQLSSKATLLHKQLMTENLNLEKAQQQQKKNEETLRELENTIGEVNKDVETIQERRAALKAEIHLLESDKSDLVHEIEQKESKARAKLMPEIQRMKDLINEVNSEMSQT
jgi:chromosome segregation ATPase